MRDERGTFYFIPHPSSLIPLFMRSLFLKVFLWFWLAMGLVVAAFFLATELTRPSEMYSHGSLTDRYTSFIAETAAVTYELEGQQGLVHYLDRVREKAGVRARLFDE